MDLYAHSKERIPPDGWQPLEDHLAEVAKLAGGMARVFGAEDWARAAGLLHDLGKGTPGFQQRLRGGPPVDHSSAGAQEAMAHFGPQVGRLLAYAIAGHHGGLPNGIEGETKKGLADRLIKTLPPLLAPPPGGLDEVRLDSLPLRPGGNCNFAVGFFVRMVFSCLVDADYLDTEAYMDKDRSLQRPAYPILPGLDARLDGYLDNLKAQANQAPLNQRRNEILQACLEAAAKPPGVFSLTVPTGGGKTISSLAFALKHALAHGQRRVIYAIPYTSIIEQNAAVFSEILGETALLEHHSNIPVPDQDDAKGYEAYQRARLACENWDAPLVVTTNVQLFESLFSNRPSRCRKLHNIAGSVIVLDEAQMLPREALLPCLEALGELARNYGCSVLLCTATQPALNDADTFRQARLEPREIAPRPQDLQEQFRRVEVVRHQRKMDNHDLAQALSEEERVLCIVNTRRQARELFEELRGQAAGEGLYHLSALMYPAHRSQKLAEIREALKKSLACRVVSTQLVEAGVDLDFPVVWRAMAGLDSIAQAAGRCNREGKLPGLGRLHLFEPAEDSPPFSLRAPIDEGRMILRKYKDPLSLEAVHVFFENLFWRQKDSLDKKEVLRSLTAGAKNLQFQFAEAAQNFRCFDSPGEAVFVCPDDRLREEIIQGLKHGPHPGIFARRAQPYTVQVYPNQLRALENSGAIIRVGEGLFPVLNDMSLYDDDLGLLVEQENYDCFNPKKYYAG